MSRSGRLLLVLPIVLSTTAPAAAQSLREHEIGSRAFAFHSRVARKVVSSDASAHARQVVQRIMGAIGLADACRIDPSRLPDASNRPNKDYVFKVVEPPHGILVAYSTGAGQYAGDGDGDISPYAEAMIKALREPGIELDKVFRRVSAHVAEVSRGNQVPTVLGNWPPQDLYLTSK